MKISTLFGYSIARHFSVRALIEHLVDVKTPAQVIPVPVGLGHAFHNAHLEYSSL